MILYVGTKMFTPTETASTKKAFPAMDGSRHCGHDASNQIKENGRVIWIMRRIKRSDLILNSIWRHNLVGAIAVVKKPSAGVE